jgi:hypothetical protein
LNHLAAAAVLVPVNARTSADDPEMWGITLYCVKS